MSERESWAWWPLDQEDRTRRDGVARGFYRLRTLWQRTEDEERGQVRRFVHVVGSKRGVVVIRAFGTGRNTRDVGMRMSTVLAAPRTLAHPRAKRDAMPGPCH